MKRLARRCRVCQTRILRVRGGEWAPLCKTCDRRRLAIRVVVTEDGDWRPIDAEWLYNAFETVRREAQ